MRAVIQRVTEASVTVDGAVIGEIEAGLLILVCAMQGDTEANADMLATKISKLRIYASARNLFVITSYPGSDPEIGNSADSDDDKDMRSIGVDRGLFPKSRVFSFGLNLTL